MNAVEVTGLSKHYPGFSLKNITFSLPQGMILGLVGENGAGKTTLIKAILRSIRADSGKILVMGADNTSAAFRQTKEAIGVVLDESFYPEELNVSQLERVMRGAYKNWDDGVFQSYMTRFELPLKKPFKNFSRGMKMKLAIAVALSHHAKLLILDEATSGLDPIVREEILHTLAEFTREETHSILISSHILSDLEKICDYIAFIQSGEMVFVEEKDRLLEEYALIHVTSEELQQLPSDAIIRTKKNPLNYEALVRRPLLPDTIPSENTNLEQIILFLASERKTLC